MYKHMRKTYSIFICVILISFSILFFTSCNNSKNIVNIDKISNLEWKVVAEIQELKTFDESGWEIPEGALVYHKQEEIKSYKIVGYKTKYKTEEYQELIGYYRPTWRPKYETKTKKVAYKEPIKEPIYATKYYYTIDRWTHLKNIELANGHDKNYNYPKYICKENERVHNVEYNYYVKLEGSGIHSSYIVDKNTWENLQIGQEVYIKKSQDGTTNIKWDILN